MLSGGEQVSDSGAGRIHDWLMQAGEELAPEVAARIIALGPEAVPSLLAILQDRQLWNIDAAGEGWPPIHAARLLGEIRNPRAVNALVETVLETTPDEFLNSTVMRALEKLGAAAVEPILASLPTVDQDTREELLEVLSNCGVRDERIYRQFEAQLRDRTTEAVLAAGNLGNYGDPRALPLLLERFEESHSEDEEGPFFGEELIELADAIQRLGGTLTPPQQARLDEVVAERQIEGRLFQRALGESGEEAFRRTLPKRGRNDLCWCGSGKKYKKCHLGRPEDLV